jgi:hypothetical protein
MSRCESCQWCDMHNFDTFLADPPCVDGDWPRPEGEEPDGDLALED